MSVVKAPPARSPSSAVPISAAREALRLCGPHLRAAVAFSALINLAYLAPTLYMLCIYDMVTPSGSGATLVFVSLALAATLVVLNTLERVRASLLSAAGMRLDNVFADRLVRRAFLGAGAANQVRLNQALRDFEKVKGAVTGSAALALFDAPWIAIYVAVCFSIHPAVGGFTLAGAVVLLGLAVWNERSTRLLSKDALDGSVVNLALQESVAASADTVRALGMGPSLGARLKAARIAAALPTLKAARINGDIGGTIRFLRLLLQSMALALGAWLAMQHQISGGAIFASSMLAARALAPIDQIVGQWRYIAQAISAYRAVHHAAAADVQGPQTVLPRPEAKLSAQDLYVANPSLDRILLNEVRFAAEGGEIVAVIGPSGAGKTTLMQTLANARFPVRGEVRLGGARYADYDPDRLGRFIGYLPQDSVLFPGTVKENIARFDTALEADIEAVDARVLEAAARAGVHEMILGLPRGYDTPLGARGEGLSAGQAQRIALARALYGDRGVLILDEPNANIDAEGEARVAAIIADLRARGALVVLSVHRLNLITVADKLLVLRKGRMEHFGPRQAVLEALKVASPGRPPNAAALERAAAQVGGVQMARAH